MGYGDLAMKLYIWVNPYTVSYGGSVVYAVAENVERARQLAREAPRMAFGGYEKPPMGAALELGAPDRILKLPCAEIYEWSE